ncbi:MAG: response regulator [Cyanophyceae cyanobacterium]
MTVGINKASMNLMSPKQSQTAGTPCVLAVDDCEDNLVILSHVLETLGCFPITATTSEAALSLIRGHQPQLILLDIVLPGIDGIALIHCLKQEKTVSQVPVIAVTGLAFKDEKRRILEAGFDAYVSKPYLLRDLEAAICHYLKVPGPNFSASCLPDLEVGEVWPPGECLPRQTLKGLFENSSGEPTAALS